ncbi:MAG: hypothetical protein LBG80_05070 [Bacteroidales bacterium]|jgi:hypothetical protein|nr:hypothetical protein [Bacteroidales bacterium]
MPKKRKIKQYRLILICLVLSILSWFAVKISKNYTQTYLFNIEFINLPTDMFLTSLSDTVIAVTMDAKGIYLLEYEFSKKNISIDYTRILPAVTQPHNKITIKKKQLDSYLINQLDFPENSMVVEPLSITLEFGLSPSKQDTEMKD